MAVLQPLIDLVELCQLHGVSRAVISPGSRSAALTLTFARNPRISCTVVMDERAAAFIALGMAQQLQRPVALVCTSGSAAYNFAPAVAEAFFQQIPLLILTADRPPEWIHQNDGQTIYQSEIYGKHVKQFFQLSADYGHPDAEWFINLAINEALLTTTEYPPGPVHVNVPIREPFYPATGERFVATGGIRRIERISAAPQLDASTWHRLLDEWEDTPRILIAVGQHTGGDGLGKVLKKVTDEFRVPVLGDAISNLPRHELSITKHDLFLPQADKEYLRPDLLITTGKSFISKAFKQFVQAYPPRQHWHISPDPHIIDTFKSLTVHIPVAPEYFFEKLFEDIDYHRFVQNDEDGQDESYLEDWLGYERKGRVAVAHYFAKLSKLTDLTALDFVLSQVPAKAQLHVANSMSVRYVNQLTIENQEIEVYSNRGTSGIDGCVSTAIGAALLTSRPVYLLVGDVAFFYDRNGLLIENLPGNLKIVLLNNAGGTIFRLIDGPASQPELSAFFETHHSFDARRTAEDSGIAYTLAEDLDQLKTGWESFSKATGPALLEIKTDPEVSAEQYREWKAYLKSVF
jgi:2-succinyl-5-enolpyruvyl-6-hydroxy-3-cyclohexene-1-carboxylate synthase